MSAPYGLLSPQQVRRNALAQDSQQLPRNGLLGDVIWNNRNKNWVQRAMQGAGAGIRNDDGSLSTHLLAAEIDEDGKVYVFPTIVQTQDGLLKKFSNPYEAMKYNKQIGEAVEFPDINTAVDFTKNYKKNPLVKLLRR